MNTTAKFAVGDEVQVVNHSEPKCNGQYGKIVSCELAYNKTIYYRVDLFDSRTTCECTEDELMEG